MKLLEFEYVKGGSETGEREWFVQFETNYEYDLYKEGEHNYYKVPDDNPNSEYFTGYGAGLIKGLLSIGLGERMTDDDIWFYFSPEEKVPEIGKRYTPDEAGDVVFKRVK